MVIVLQFRADIPWLKSELEYEFWLFYNWQKYAKKQYLAFQLEFLVLREWWQVLRFANKGNFTRSFNENSLHYRFNTIRVSFQENQPRYN